MTNPVSSTQSRHGPAGSAADAARVIREALETHADRCGLQMREMRAATSALDALDVLVAELADTRAELSAVKDDHEATTRRLRERRDENAALLARAVAAEARAEEHRIEADCAMRDFDGLELDAGIMREALERIAAKRPNQSFDPWAVEVARAALAAVEDTGEASAQTADAGKAEACVCDAPRCEREGCQDKPGRVPGGGGDQKEPA